MKKTSSKIIIVLLLTILFGAFGVGKVEAVTQPITIDSNVMEWLNKSYNGFDFMSQSLTPQMVSEYNTYKASQPSQVQSTLVPNTLVDNKGNLIKTEVDPTTGKLKEAAPSKGFFDWLTGEAMDLITGPVAKIVMTVNGVLLQAIAIPIMSILFRISAALLDMSVNFTLSTQIFKDTSMGVITVWVLIRDICNITFIFILLWSAIQMIIGVGSAGAKKMVANVIIAALLINFSLFITRIVIDAGNILAVALFSKIQAGVSAGGVAFAGQGLGAIIMQALGMSGITGAANSALSGGFFSVSFGMISYLQLITLIVAFIVFMYAMLLMVARIVALIFLAALSPIGFMGDVLPKLSEYSKLWRETLYGQVMIAPTFLLFVYLIIQVSTAFNKIPPAGAIAGASGEIVSVTANDAASYLAYFKYVMIIMLLIIAVKVTKKMTGPIGAAVEKFGTAAAGIALGAATGGAALLARQTIGRGAASLAANEKLANAATKGGLGGFAARMTLKGANSTSKASFDARNTSGFKSATGFIGDQTGIKVDYNRGAAVQKDGYRGAVERQEKKAVETGKLIDKADVSVSSDEIAKEKAKRETVDQEQIDKNKREIQILEEAKRQGTIPDEEEKKLKKLREETDALANKPKVSDDDIKKEIEKTKKAARLATHAENQENSPINRLFRNERDRKAAAKKVREAGNPKDAKALAAEWAKKQAEENAAAGINPPTPATPPAPPAPNPAP